eukprot:TRINITY_DN93949_c0_g1_i1.p1 TRINITY_DN93949_c0_g1~~TRINITY_DN93949_c0_g1_i1.p1  ORF type:complete len:484 (+),score=77.50 TRINITY_DN93949_c0_g1_i1:74-1453(+)
MTVCVRGSRSTMDEVSKSVRADPTISPESLKALLSSEDIMNFKRQIASHHTWSLAIAQRLLGPGQDLTARRELAYNFVWFYVLLSRLADIGLISKYYANDAELFYTQVADMLLNTKPGRNDASTIEFKPEESEEAARESEISCPADSYLKRVRRHAKYWICLRRRQLVDRHLWRQGFWSDCLLMMNLIRAWGRHPTILEVGAYNGVCSLAFAALRAHVISVEANPKTAALFRASARMNGFKEDRLRIFSVAVGASNGWTSVLETSGNAASSVLKLQNGSAAFPHGHVLERIAELRQLAPKQMTSQEAAIRQKLEDMEEKFSLLRNHGRVRVRDLDSLLEEADAKRPDLVKIDTNGHELQVFAGARNLLAARPAVFQFEVFPGQPSHTREIMDIFWEHGYLQFADLGQEAHPLTHLLPETCSETLMQADSAYIDVIAIEPGWMRNNPLLFGIATRNATMP